MLDAIDSMHNGEKEKKSRDLNFMSKLLAGLESRSPCKVSVQI